MGITVAEPGFESENESSTKLCAEGGCRFEHLLLWPETYPQTDCSDDATAAPRHSTAQHITAQHSTAQLHSAKQGYYQISTQRHRTPHHSTPLAQQNAVQWGRALHPFPKVVKGMLPKVAKESGENLASS